MSSRRNHAIRSRKTYSTRMSAARMNLAGGPPKGAATGMRFNRPGTKRKMPIGFLTAMARVMQPRNREKRTTEE